ncbi:MAG: hypothetical protein L3J50_11120, partial [Emcibacter sp.]|nr:hypothetical protein [Emcibacter sp.]
TKPVIEISPQQEGVPVDIRPVAQPHSMKWSGDAGQFVEIIFDGTESLRIRGVGFGLKLTPYLRTEVYSTEKTIGKGKLATFNILPMQRKFQVECLKGDMCWQARREDETGKEFDVELRVEGESWEIAIDMFTSVWLPRERQSF